GLAARTRPAELSREVRPRVTVAQALECPMPFGTDGGVDPRGSARSELRSDGKLKYAPPMRRRRPTSGGPPGVRQGSVPHSPGTIACNRFVAQRNRCKLPNAFYRRCETFVLNCTYSSRSLSELAPTLSALARRF